METAEGSPPAKAGFPFLPRPRFMRSDVRDILTLIIRPPLAHGIWYPSLLAPAASLPGAERTRIDPQALIGLGSRSGGKFHGKNIDDFRPAAWATLANISGDLPTADHHSTRPGTGANSPTGRHFGLAGADSGWWFSGGLVVRLAVCPGAIWNALPKSYPADFAVCHRDQ